MIIRSLNEAKCVDWGAGQSRRFLLESDNMGYSLTDTIVAAGTRSLLEYKRHLEACYCIDGRGWVESLDGTRHVIEPGTMYALNEHDAHYLCADPDVDMRLVCVFTPALRGDEAHNLAGGQSSHY